MSKTWKDIWSKRPSMSGPNLQELIELDGFDNPGTSFDEKAWTGYVKEFQKSLKIEERDSLFEYGCGAGAFIYPMFMSGHTIGGVDYSETQIQTAHDAMPSAQFQVADIRNFELETKYDFTIAHSVFQYLDCLNSALNVCKSMIAGAVKCAAILDVPDLNLKTDSELARHKSSDVYSKSGKKTSLSHLYFERSWFQRLADIEEVKVETSDNWVDGYVNSGYRFNVIITKM